MYRCSYIVVIITIQLSQVCGSDGVTYMSICDLAIQSDIRLDYRGTYLNMFL